MSNEDTLRKVRPEIRQFLDILQFHGAARVLKLQRGEVVRFAPQVSQELLQLGLAPRNLGAAGGRKYPARDLLEIFFEHLDDGRTLRRSSPPLRQRHDSRHADRTP